MKKFLLTCLILLILLIAAWLSSRSLYRTWNNPAPQEGNIFSGDIKIEKIKTKEGSQHEYFTVISDNLNHALSCSQAEGSSEYLCLPFLKSPNPVTPDTTFDQIVIETSMTPLHLRLKKQDYIFYHVLDMEMSYVGPDCATMDDKGCNYIKLPRYEYRGF